MQSRGLICRGRCKSSLELQYRAIERTSPVFAERIIILGIELHLEPIDISPTRSSDYLESLRADTFRSTARNDNTEKLDCCSSFPCSTCQQVRVYLCKLTIPKSPKEIENVGIPAPPVVRQICWLFLKKWLRTNINAPKICCSRQKSS
jgi:hypothetical protein